MKHIFIINPAAGKRNCTAELMGMAKGLESRHGLRQITYMKELGMGNDRYTLLDIDHGDAPISLEEAVEGLEPFKG